MPTRLISHYDAAELLKETLRNDGGRPNKTGAQVGSVFTLLHIQYLDNLDIALVGLQADEEQYLYRHIVRI